MNWYAPTHHPMCPLYRPEQPRLSARAHCDCESWHQLSSVQQIAESQVEASQTFTISVINDAIYSFYFPDVEVREVILDQEGNIIAAAPWPSEKESA